MIKEYIEKIVKNKNQEDMDKLSDILVDVLYELKEYDEDEYNDYKICIYEIANGKILTDEIKEEWVKNMQPMAKWSKEDVGSVVNQYGIKIPISSMYVIMNMLYSDMKSALGNGDDTESLERYIKAANDWYNDEDAKNTKEEKLYNYWKYIVK